ncbi:hypothetical protein ABZY58_26035 [Micromonospora tulbaghiae]|uniref:hypothetical protein n=1 Tax=Micromonospora tulbaghiae TaxID=479978 RepID=UPI0033ACD89C
MTEGVPVLPTLGRIVHYRGDRGMYAPRAAIVTATVDTLDQRGVDAGEVPALDSPSHVPQGRSADGHEATAGTIPPGTWCWPPRV